MSEHAKRFNTGKTRFALIPTTPLEYLAEVYTKGAHKYSVYVDEAGNRILGKDISIEEVAKRKLVMVESGADNWRKGQLWLDSFDSTMRHLHAWMSGEDFDKDLGTRHLANAAWGIFSLMEYEKTHPEMDNRHHTYLKPKRIGLDVDEVLADFTGAYKKKFGIEIPKYWNYDRQMYSRLKSLDNDFWRSIEPKIDPSSLPFEPHCYITSRICDNIVTQMWLDQMGFPTANVYTVGHDQSKVDVAKNAGVEIFVDDSYKNFVELNNGGVFTYLMDAPHNQRYDVGFRRIKSLNEIV